MNEIINKFLLVGDKFMSEMHLKQPGFTSSACGPFTKNKEQKSLCKLEIQILFIKKFKYSTFNEGKSAIAEKFIRTLKNKIFKHMTAISRNIYFDALDDIVNKYNDMVHRTIKMKPIDVTSDSLAEYNEDANKKKKS